MVKPLRLASPRPSLGGGQTDLTGLSPVDRDRSLCPWRTRQFPPKFAIFAEGVRAVR